MKAGLAWLAAGAVWSAGLVLLAFEVRAVAREWRAWRRAKRAFRDTQRRVELRWRLNVQQALNAEIEEISVELVRLRAVAVAGEWGPVEEAEFAVAKAAMVERRRLRREWLAAVDR